MDCAKRGVATRQVLLPKEETISDVLLSCMVENSVTDGFSDAELSLRSVDLDWCFPPSFLSAKSTCKSQRFDPSKFLFPCLGMEGFPKRDELTIYYESPISHEGGSATTSGAHANDTVIVVDSLIASVCSLLDAIRTPPAVLCLVHVCQTVTEPPSTMPNDQPFAIPSDRPSAIPSDWPSMAPSDQPSMLPSDQPSMIPSDQPSTFPSDQPSTMPSNVPFFSASITPTEIPSMAGPPINNVSPTGVPFAEPKHEPTKQPISLDDLPSVAAQIEILMRFVIEGVGAVESPPSESFLDTLQVALELTLSAEVRGHESVGVVSVISQIPTTADIVIVAVARRECSACSASSISDEIVFDYLTKLKNSNEPGGLTQQLEFQAYIRDVEALLKITIDEASVGMITPSNMTTSVTDALGSSGVACNDLWSWVLLTIVSIVIVVAT
jgi:hypothetical protein